MLQVELIKAGGVGAQTPPPDERPYFTAAHWAAREEPYDPPAPDSENDLYVMKFGKRKAKAWPRSNHGFEHEKAKVRKRLRRMKEHMKELKRRHRQFKGPEAGEIINSDDEARFSWVKWLNPQDGKAYVRARAAADAGGQHYQ